ncbi:MAG TPA: hypothetical protein VMH40_20525 [Myxococcaceae bacterium]|nr:hypothetical protein [Myxococcaceae bacterium]
MDRARSPSAVRRGRHLGELVLLLSCAGCATSPPAPQAYRVIPVNGVLGTPCENLGTVIGESQAKSWGSGSTTAEELASQATADAMQRAEARGATHIYFSPVSLQQNGGAPVGATLTGVAFRCPPAHP